MEFQIKDKNGQWMYYTAEESCVPVNKLDSMHAAGLTFYVDDKKISLSTAKTRFKNIKPVKIPKYNGRPVLEDVPLQTSNFVDSEKQSKEVRPSVPDNNLKLDLEHLDSPITSRTIVCLNTGKVYKNQSEAAKDLNVDPAYISDCVCHNKEYKGYRFKRAVDLK